jgi:hypothetical protein
MAAGVALALCGGSASAVPTLVASFVFDDSSDATSIPLVDLSNDLTIYPATLDGSQTLYSWGSPGNPDNSERTVTYTGTQSFSFSHLEFYGTAYSNSELGVTSYGEDLEVRLFLNGDDDTAAVAPTLTFPAGELLDRTAGGTDLSDPAHEPDFIGIANRNVSNGTQFTFVFSEIIADGDDVPDATYGQDFEIQVWGEVLDVAEPSLSVTPSSLDFGNVRVGTTSPTQDATASNNGDPGSTLSNVVLGAAPGDFNGGPSTPADLDQGESTSQAYTYSPGEIGSDNETVTVSADSVPSQDVTLLGNGVGPIFDLQGFGTSGLIDLGSVDLGDATTQTLTMDNLFLTELGDLTDLTILNLTLLPGSTDFGFAGFTPNTVISTTDLSDFLLEFTPSAVGTILGTLQIQTDVGAAKGDSGEFYTFQLSGVGTDPSGPTPNPAPAAWLLLATGLVGLRAAHRRSS